MQTMPRGWRATVRAAYKTHGLIASRGSVASVRRLMMLTGLGPVDAAMVHVYQIMEWRRMYSATRACAQAFRDFGVACSNLYPIIAQMYRGLLEYEAYEEQQ